MKSLLKIEQLTILILCLLFFYHLQYNWWWFIGLFFVPDISMVGYAVNHKVGGIFYNILHHKSLPIVVLILGYLMSESVVLMIGTIWLAHISFDRMLGYGLKHLDHFQNTHLGKIGKHEH